VDSSRSRKSVFNCLNHIRLFRDIPELITQVRILCKRQFLPPFNRGPNGMGSLHRDTKTPFPFTPPKSFSCRGPRASTIDPIAPLCRQDLPALASPWKTTPPNTARLGSPVEAPLLNFQIRRSTPLFVPSAPRPCPLRGRPAQTLHFAHGF